MMIDIITNVRGFARKKQLWLFLGLLLVGFLIGYASGSTSMAAGDVLSFVGAVLGAALTVYGSMMLVDYSASAKARQSAATLGKAIRSLSISHKHLALIDAAEVSDEKLPVLFDEVERLHEQRDESLELLDTLLVQNPSSDPDVILSLLRLRKALRSDQSLWDRERHIVEQRSVRSHGFKVHLAKLQPSAARIVEKTNDVLESLSEPTVTVGRAMITLDAITGQGTASVQ